MSSYISRLANRRFKGSRLRSCYQQAFHFYDRGVSGPEVCNALEIAERCEAKAKAAYVALFPQNAENITQVCPSGKTYLIDECLPPSSVLPVTALYGLSVHVDHLKKAGTKDPELYRWAIEQGYTAIFSSDMAFKLKGRKNPFQSRDLTGVATAFAIEAIFDEIAQSQFSISKHELPTVVRFSKKIINHEVMERLLSKHSKKIEFALRRKISPYITVSEEGVTLGPSYQNIFDEFMERDNKEGNRVMRWKENWVNRIKAKYGGKKLSRKKIKRIEEMAESNARECVAKRSQFPRLVA